MPRLLEVWLHGLRAGSLIQEDGGRLRFSYEPGYVENPASRPLSVSLPLSREPFDDGASRPFFSGLLPDDVARRRLAAHLGLSERNPFSLLGAVGGECAGAISLLPEGENPPSEDPADAIELDDRRLAEVFARLERRPLLAGEEGVRLSLAGAQNKLAVRIVGEKLLLMKGGAATTHILKPMISDLADVTDSVHNEAFCLALAQRVGIAAANAEIRLASGEPYLAVERYDRVWSEGALLRLHQEDFCQALGIPPENKYQREGGPGVADSLELLHGFSTRPAFDRLSFLKLFAFNFLIGNADAHAKNYSLLHGKNGPRLAPAYDLLSTAIYPELSGRMAMKIGGKYGPEDVYRRHWHRLVPDTATARRDLDKTLDRLAEDTRREAEALAVDLERKGFRSPIFDAIRGVISGRADRIA